MSRFPRLLLLHSLALRSACDARDAIRPFLPSKGRHKNGRKRGGEKERRKEGEQRRDESDDQGSFVPSSLLVCTRSSDHLLEPAFHLSSLVPLSPLTPSLSLLLPGARFPSLFTPLLRHSFSPDKMVTLMPCFPLTDARTHTHTRSPLEAPCALLLLLLLPAPPLADQARLLPVSSVC